MSNDQFHKLVLFLAILVYVITAFNSHGYYHADEHYQIIEFAGLKLGTHSPADVAWEYKAQIRPALQPTISFIVFKGLQAVNITNPYTQALFLRLLTAFLSLFVIHFFIKNTEYQLKNDRSKKLYYFLSYLLWFIPFLSVRFSSETWSGLFFLWSVATYFDPVKNKMKPYIIGLLAGLSFLFRFQAAFLLPGFILWLLFVEKADLKYILKIVAAFLIAFTLGILIDCWFYGHPVLTSWNYFYTTIINDSAPGFGESSWYYYFAKLIQSPTFFSH
jgi:phosphatidylinositol glycan class B